MKRDRLPGNGQNSHTPMEGKAMQDGSPSEARLEARRRPLLAMRARLRGSLTQMEDSVRSGGSESTNASPDTADRASESGEQDLALNLLGSTTGTLDQIDAALQRVEDGSYGRCAECDAKIPRARLDAVPYSTCCVQCAARREHAA